MNPLAWLSLTPPSAQPSASVISQHMSWSELAEQIAKLTPEQAASSVTIYCQGLDEFYPVVGDYPFVEATEEFTDVLDPGHPYLVI